jgi:hypothetical protein
MGRHQGDRRDGAEQYGRHSQANARGLSVAALLARVVEAGHGIQLAWRGEEATSVTDRSQEFPTAVLPVVRDQHPDTPSNDDETEPTTATREARRWLRPPGFLWWQRSFAG